jgi:hypothetical protein
MLGRAFKKRSASCLCEKHFQCTMKFDGVLIKQLMGVLVYGQKAPENRDRGCFIDFFWVR